MIHQKNTSKKYELCKTLIINNFNNEAIVLMYNKLLICVIIILAVLLFRGCEDNPNNVYVSKVYIEAYLLVDNPISNVKIMYTQPLTDSFNLVAGMIRDADVRIITGRDTLKLIYDNLNNTGYYLSDKGYLIKPETSYQLKVSLKDGSKISGSTMTPARIFWNKKASKFLYYPQDSIKLPVPDSLRVSWNPVKDISYYMLSVKCLDTLNYGKYLNPATDKMNRRVWRQNMRDERYKELTTYTLFPAVSVPIAWTVFKWFGVQEVTVYAPEWSLVRWFMQYSASNAYDPLLSNLDGGIGVFSSASVIKDTVFLIANQ